MHIEMQSFKINSKSTGNKKPTNKDLSFVPELRLRVVGAILFEELQIPMMESKPLIFLDFSKESKKGIVEFDEFEVYY